MMDYNEIINHFVSGKDIVYSPKDGDDQEEFIRRVRVVKNTYESIKQEYIRVMNDVRRSCGDNVDKVVDWFAKHPEKVMYQMILSQHIESKKTGKDTYNILLWNMVRMQLHQGFLGK